MEYNVQKIPLDHYVAHMKQMQCCETTILQKKKKVTRPSYLYIK